MLKELLFPTLHPVPEAALLNSKKKKKESSRVGKFTFVCVFSSVSNIVYVRSEKLKKITDINPIFINSASFFHIFRHFFSKCEASDCWSFFFFFQYIITALQRITDRCSDTRSSSSGTTNAAFMRTLCILAESSENLCEVNYAPVNLDTWGTSLAKTDVLKENSKAVDTATILTIPPLNDAFFYLHFRLVCLSTCRWKNSTPTIKRKRWLQMRVDVLGLM